MEQEHDDYDDDDMEKSEETEQEYYDYDDYYDEGTFESLIEALSDKDPDVRELAVWGLYNQGYSDAVQPLIAVLKDENAEVRRAAAVTLGTLDDRAAVAPPYRRP